LETILNFLPEGIIVHDKNYKIDFQNEGVSNVLSSVFKAQEIIENFPDPSPRETQQALLLDKNGNEKGPSD